MQPLSPLTQRFQRSRRRPSHTLRSSLTILQRTNVKNGRGAINQSSLNDPFMVAVQGGFFHSAGWKHRVFSLEANMLNYKVNERDSVCRFIAQCDTDQTRQEKSTGPPLGSPIHLNDCLLEVCRCDAIASVNATMDECRPNFWIAAST